MNSLPTFPRWKKKVLISGSRSSTDYDRLAGTVALLTSRFRDYVIVTGGCGKGADKLAADFAFRTGRQRIEFLADWDAHGKSAGPRRNREMAVYCTHAVFFWDGRSPGTADCIEQVRKLGKPYRVVRF